MQPVDTGGSISGSHDESENPLCTRYNPGSRIGDFYVLLPLNDSRLPSLLSTIILGLISHALLLPTALGEADERNALDRRSQAIRERILVVGKLVDKIAGVAPGGELRVGRGRRERGARAGLLVVLEQIGGVLVSGA
jgi:hypothetical protein